MHCPSVSYRLSALTWSVLLGENEAKMLRFVVGQYASALLSLKNVYVIVAKYSDETFLDFWQVFCKIYRDTTKNTGDESYSFDVVDSDVIPFDGDWS